MEGLFDPDVYLAEAATLVLHSLLYSGAATVAIKRRQAIVNWIDGLSTHFVGLRAFAVGALFSNINPHVSTEQVELTLFFDKSENPRSDRWFLGLYEALCKHSSLDRAVTVRHPYNSDTPSLLPTVVERISYFPREQKLEAIADGVLVSIKPNDICSLAFASLLEDINDAVGGESLLKRSILLIKAWCCFEAPHMRPDDATAEYIKAFESSLQLLCADKVIEVMVMALFSSNFLNDATSEQVQEPLKILLRFLDIFSRFDWANWAVSVAGLIALPHSSPTAPAIGIAAGTNPMGMSRDEDVGTETDSPLSSAIPSPLSSSSCESEAYPYPVVGDANLTGIINQYRVRLRLSSLSEEDNTPIRQLSTDTDVEDCSCDYDKNRMKMRRQSGLSKLEPGELRRGSVQSSGGAVEVPPTEDEEKLSQLMQWGMIVLDPTKNLTNLCVSDSTSTQVSKYKQQEALKRTFAAGLVIVKRTIDALEAPFKFFDETVETPDLNKEDKSSAAQVAGIVSQIFPTLSKLTAIKESLSALHNGAVVDAAELVDRLQKDSSSVHNNLQYAEEAMAAKMSTTTATAPPAQPSHSLTFKEDQDTESINSAPLSMCLTLPDQVDNLALSEISISKSFSSFDSDVGSEYSINLGGEATNDAAIRFLSANTLPEEPPFVSYDSYMSKQQQQQQLNMSLSLMDPSGMDSYNPTPAYQNEGAQHGHQPHQSMSKILGSSSLEYIKPSALDFHHHHQKTLLRHTQSIGQGGLAYSQSSPSIIRPPSVPVPRAVDFQQEHMSAPGLHQLPIGHSPTNVPTQPTKPPGVPFIQPFVVKEMQVWVPGKFGASSGSPAVPKAPIPLPVAGVKSVDFVKGSYPPMAPVGHVAGPLTSAGRYSPVLSTAGPRSMQHNYIYPEEDYEMNWIDQVPDEGNARMRANRMALAGHQQMQGQMRDRQRQSNQQHADLVLASQYSGVSRVSGRSPLSEAGQISPHSVSPPVPSPSSFAAMQSKRPPGLNIAANNSQISRLSYGIGASSGVAIGQSDAHAEHRRALLLHEQRMMQMNAEKNRSTILAAQKERSEAQLPSFLRDL